MLVPLKRIIRAGWLNLKRQSGLSFATIFIMTMTISLITAVYLLQGSTQFLVSYLQEKVDISVYFKEDSLEEDIIKTKEELTKISEVKNVEYISREEALNRFIENHKDDLVLIESLVEVGKNPLPASLNIKSWQASQYEAVSSFLENSQFKNLIDKIDYRKNKEIIEKVFEVSSGIKTTGIVFSLVLAAVVFLVAFNTIKLAIYSTREEISIMRLVGASNWFIRGPFIFQGVIIGVIATIATLLIFTVISFFLGPKTEIILPGFNVFNYFKNNLFTIILMQLVAGIGLGVASSWIAMRKYLEV